MSDQTPAPNTPTPPNPTPPAATPPSDPVALAKRVGELEAENKRVSGEYKEYKERVDPVIETLYSDKDLLEKAVASHDKRLGKTPATPPPDDKNKPPVTVDPVARKALNNNSMERFEDKYGINKLDAEKQKDLRGRIGVMVKNLVDPNNNKSVQQVFDELDPDKFSWYMENAYSLINKEEDIKTAREQGRNEALNGYQGGAGAIGSVPGSSLDLNQITLTPKERAVAKSMGVSEEKYLANKKRIKEMQQQADED